MELRMYGRRSGRNAESNDWIKRQEELGNVVNIVGTSMKEYFDLHITFIDGTTEIVMKINELSIVHEVLHAKIEHRDRGSYYSDSKVVASFPITNIKKYVRHYEKL